jgi:hypothetical protein
LEGHQGQGMKRFGDDTAIVLFTILLFPFLVCMALVS